MQSTNRTFQGAIRWFSPANGASGGSCGYPVSPQRQFTASLPVSVMGAAPSALCGNCIQISVNGRTAVALITDTNQSTGSDIVVSTATFTQLGDPNVGVLNGQWAVVQCPAGLN